MLSSTLIKLSPFPVEYPELSEAKKFVHGHSAAQWQSQAQNPGARPLDFLLHLSGLEHGFELLNQSVDIS